MADRGAREAARRPGRAAARAARGQRARARRRGRGAADRAARRRARRRGHDRQLRRPARGGRAGGGGVELGARDHPRAQGRHRDAAARSDRRGVLPPRPARRPVAARRRVRHRRGRDHDAVPRAGPRRAHRARTPGPRRPAVLSARPSTGSGSRSSSPRRAGSSATARCPPGPDGRSTTRRACSPRCARGRARGTAVLRPARTAQAPTSAGRSASPAAGRATPGGTSCAATCSAWRCASPAAPSRPSAWPCWRPGPSRATCSPRPRRMVQTRDGPPARRRIAGPSWPPATPTSSTPWRGRGWLDARTAAHAREAARMLASNHPTGAPSTVRPGAPRRRRVRAEPAPGRRARRGRPAPGPGTLRELEFPWPSEPFGQVAEVDEAAGTEDQMIEALHGRAGVPHPAGAAHRRASSTPAPTWSCSRSPAAARSTRTSRRPRQHGVAVTFAPGRNATATAEYTIGMMLAALRGIAARPRRGGRGRWEATRFVFATSGLELEGTTVGLVGRGRDRLPGGAHPARLRRARARVRPLRRARLPAPRRDERGAGRAAVVRAGGVAARAGHPGEPGHDRSGAARRDAARGGAGQLRPRGAASTTPRWPTRCATGTCSPQASTCSTWSRCPPTTRCAARRTW